MSFFVTAILNAEKARIEGFVRALSLAAGIPGRRVSPPAHSNLTSPRLVQIKNAINALVQNASAQGAAARD